MGTPFSKVYIERVLDPSYRNWKLNFFEASCNVHRAHLCMLAERGIVTAATAAAIKRGIEELEAVVRLCNGLQTQNDLLKTAMGIPTFK